MTENGKRQIDLANVAMFWPTPNVRDIKGLSGTGRQERKGHLADSLSNATHLWSTPRASPNENRQTQASPSQQAGEHGMNLATQASKSEFWATPSVAAAKGGMPQDSKGKRDLRLDIQAFPNFLPDPETLTPGGPFSQSGPTSPLPSGNPVSGSPGSPSGTLRPARKRRGKALSPAFVEWLQGFPEGWTALER
jgi:hypothetical protein